MIRRSWWWSSSLFPNGGRRRVTARTVSRPAIQRRLELAKRSLTRHDRQSLSGRLLASSRYGKNQAERVPRLGG
jgi:hypothetical protein